MSQINGKISPVYENYEVLSRKASSNPYYTGIQRKSAGGAATSKYYTSSSRKSSDYHSLDHHHVKTGEVSSNNGKFSANLFHFHSSAKTGILKSKSSSQPLNEQGVKKAPPQITFQSTVDIKEKTDKLKEQDPIYRRRAQQLQMFKMLGKAPKYETLDPNLLQAKVSKNYIEKRKKELIEEASKVGANKFVRHQNNPYDYASQQNLRNQIEFFVKNYQLIT